VQRLGQLALFIHEERLDAVGVQQSFRGAQEAHGRLGPPLCEEQATEGRERCRHGAQVVDLAVERQALGERTPRLRILTRRQGNVAEIPTVETDETPIAQALPEGLWTAEFRRGGPFVGRWG